MMIKHSDHLQSNPSKAANDLYEQLLHNGRSRASYSLHDAYHKRNIRTLIGLTALVVLAGAAATLFYT